LGGTIIFFRPAAVLLAVVASVSLQAPRAEAAQAFRAHWMLDEVGSRTASDASGNGNNGTNYNVTGNGSGYSFNGVSSRVIVPNAASLNPGSVNFSFGVTMTMTSPPTPSNETYDVLRKGIVTTKGGDYKLEIMNSGGKAVAHCVVKSIRSNGVKVLASVTSTSQLADGVPHTVTCTKTSTGLTVRVDSLPARTKTYSGGLGSVSNTSNLGLGAKAESKPETGFDWFKGVLSDAWVAAG
jgi:hypothetical protein